MSGQYRRVIIEGQSKLREKTLYEEYVPQRTVLSKLPKVS